MRRSLPAIGLLVLAAATLRPAAAGAADAAHNDYPTVARADYVLGCMASNGQNRRVLEQCACSIDLIATIVPYEEYVDADTILRLRQLGGEKGALFRSSPKYRDIVADLKRAQAEAEMRCF